MASETQTRFRWGVSGKRQSPRQVWCPLSNVRQRGVVLEFRAEPQDIKASRAGL